MQQDSFICVYAFETNDRVNNGLSEICLPLGKKLSMHQNKKKKKKKKKKGSHPIKIRRKPITILEIKTFTVNLNIIQTPIRENRALQYQSTQLINCINLIISALFHQFGDLGSAKTSSANRLHTKKKKKKRDLKKERK